MSKAPRSLARVRDRALDVIGSDEFFIVAFVPGCISKSQASFEDLTRVEEIFTEAQQHLTISRHVSPRGGFLFTTL